MQTIEVVLSLFAACAALAYIASKLHVPYPIFLVLGGLALSKIPNLPHVALDPHIVFLLFLPPILYYAGMMTSWRDFKANKRPIGLLALGLVLFTTLLVGVAAHLAFGMPWAAGFVLGAIVSPPDAVAATAIMSRMRLPKRIIVILEGESLVNDATALVAYRLAIVAVVTGQFSISHAAISFVWVAAGGVAIGLLAGLVIAWIRPRLNDKSVEGLVSLLTPYAAYLPAEHAGVSGVLAAVTAGVYLSRRMPQITTAQSRLRLFGVWETFIFILNALVFILIGLQLPAVIEHLHQTRQTHLVLHAIWVSAIVVALRMAWVFPATYLPRIYLPTLSAADPTPPCANIFIVAWTGMRGIVSLASALAIPITLADGVTPFPYRDFIIFLTFGVILFTLVLQGLTLPLMLRLLKLTDDGVEHKEELRARYEGLHAALSRLDTLVLLGEAEAQTIAPVRADLQHRANYITTQLTGRESDPTAILTCTSQESAQRHALEAQHLMLVKLRDDNVISDEVLRRIQNELDLEESRLG